MNRTTRLWGAALLTPVLLLAAGCGQHNTPQASGHAHKHHKKSGSQNGGSPSSSSTAPSTTPSSPPAPTSSVPIQTASSAPSPVLTSMPPAGGVAGANQVQATVNSVQADGTAHVNGQSYDVYLLNVTLRNPTTAMILFQLNDIVVGPTGSSTAYSLNDFDLTGITEQNSLFPYPIVATHPAAVVVRVPSGASVTGDFTVETSNAPSYSVNIVGTSGAVATFSA